jgi:hypothetical protein
LKEIVFPSVSGMQDANIQKQDRWQISIVHACMTIFLQVGPRLFVIPMSNMLFSASTPSILVSNWLTMVSCTPEPLCTLPLCLQMASISSKMMT